MTKNLFPQHPTPPQYMPEVHPDKVRVNGYYNEDTGACSSIEVILNYDGISREDLQHTIREVFSPHHPPAGDAPSDTYRHHELGETTVISTTVASRAETTSAAETVTRLTFPFTQHPTT